MLKTFFFYLLLNINSEIVIANQFKIVIGYCYDYFNILFKQYSW